MGIDDPNEVWNSLVHGVLSGLCRTEADIGAVRERLREAGDLGMLRAMYSEGTDATEIGRILARLAAPYVSGG